MRASRPLSLSGHRLLVLLWILVLPIASPRSLLASSYDWRLDSRISGWQDTSVRVLAGDMVKIQASGSVVYGADGGRTDADGCYISKRYAMREVHA